jgi:hypothetical protein
MAGRSGATESFAAPRFFILNLGDLDLFGVWDFEFGILFAVTLRNRAWSFMP